MADVSEVGKDKLVADLKLVIGDAEELLRLSAHQAGDKVAELRVKMQDHLTSARARLSDAESVVVEQTRAAARATDDYVHDNPWRAIGVAAGVGLVLGMLIGRR
ncbi:MAG: DUF883 domain-containing protein [Betaproteobacteria bacterium]|nr:DUF883 domain-containing protein [Betaproteobacteria bacterium]